MLWWTKLFSYLVLGPSGLLWRNAGTAWICHHYNSSDRDSWECRHCKSLRWDYIHHLLIKQHHHNPSNSHLSWDGIPLFYVWVWLELSLERLTNLGWQVSWQRNSKFVFPMISSYESASDSEYTNLRICINSLLLFTCCLLVCWVPWKELKQNKRKKLGDILLTNVQ